MLVIIIVVELCKNWFRLSGSLESAELDERVLLLLKSVFDLMPCHMHLSSEL